MSGYAGFPTLESARDLLSKLERDIGRMKGNPLDPYPAVDFFVTAEHVGEWKGADTRYRHKPEHHGGIGCLLVACHIAIGIKHFEVRQPNQPVQTGSAVDGAFQPNVFQWDAFDVGGLEVTHDAAGDLPARTVSTIELASEVLTFWREHVCG